VVFGDAREESSTNQLAVAWVVVNRVNNRQFTYPNTVNEVVYQKYGSTYEFATMGDTGHDNAWNSEKASKSIIYTNSIAAASGALCGSQADPTGCALAYCTQDPCPATSNTLYAIAYNKKKIGNKWFVCQQPRTW
jgi:spore germination cell wall hydrolase CwlJ-like protein